MVVGASLGAVVVDQSAQVLAEHERLRAHPSVGVHDIRVAMRRLRSTLTVFADYVPEETRALVGQLRDAAARLSRARDREVLADRAAARGEPLDLTAQHLAEHDPRAAVLDELGSAQFLDTLAEVRSLAQMEIRQPTLVRTDQLLQAQLLRVTRRLDRAVAADDAERDVRLHDLRKAVKRARYVLEEFGRHPPDPETCRVLAEAQEYLGHWQDAVVETIATGGHHPTHSTSEWISLARRLADLREQIAPSISVRSAHDPAGA